MISSGNIARGVADSFDHWLAHHDRSFPALIEDTLARVFTQWLEDHSQDLIERFSNKMAQRAMQQASGALAEARVALAEARKIISRGSTENPGNAGKEGQVG